MYKRQACSCKNKHDSHGLIILPFALGEISKIYLGSGVEESLANINKLTHALIIKGDKKIPSATIKDLLSGKNLFEMFRAVIWSNILIYGNAEDAETMFADLFFSNIPPNSMTEDRSNFKEVLNNKSVPEV